MNGLTLFFVEFAYVSIAILIVGFLARIWTYDNTPSPLKIPLTPAPVGSASVAYRMVQDAGFFNLLFLFTLRLVTDRTFYISLLTDYALLVLLILIAAKGILTKYFVRTDIVSVKSFVMSFVTLRPEALPMDVVPCCWSPR